MGTLSALGQQAAKTALLQSSGKLTPKQAELHKAIQDGLKPLEKPDVRAALSELEWTRPNRDIAQADGVALRAPPLNGEPDNHVYTRVGIFEESKASGVDGPAAFLLTLYDAKGETPSGKEGGYGNPDASHRILRLDGDEFKAFLQANDVGAVGGAFTKLFQNMAAGGTDAQSGGGWGGR